VIDVASQERKIMRDEQLRANQDHQNWDIFPTTNVTVAGDLDDVANTNSPYKVISEIGLVLAIVLGAVLGINMMLVALHIG
jgi:hypothetical protein